jgi:hypothetical protein
MDIMFFLYSTGSPARKEVNLAQEADSQFLGFSPLHQSGCDLDSPLIASEKNPIASSDIFPTKTVPLYLFPTHELVCKEN